MYRVEGTHIILTRGDTFLAQVEITTSDGVPYSPVEGEVVRFALKPAVMAAGGRRFAAARPVILKRIPIETMLLQLNPDDTKPLDFGHYKYDIEITQINGYVTTFIADADFTLAPEVD